MKTIPLLILIFLISACSWQEYFVVQNNSNQAIEISYSLSKTDSFKLFDEFPSIYKLKKSNEIDWSKVIKVQDLDSSILQVKLILEPKSALIFGTLSNDNYENAKQNFINGRVFNLNEISIKKDEKNTRISRAQFDSYFKKKEGLISFEVE